MIIKRLRAPLLLAACLLTGVLFKVQIDHRRAEAADAVWRKSLTLGAETPMRANMTITQRVQGQTTTTEARVLQGSHGQYRVEFSAPAEARGRIVTSDGHAFWTYEPKQNLLIKNAQVSGTGQGARRTDPLVERNYVIRLLSDQDTAAGRPAYLLELAPRQAGKSSQRRWIDRQTFKTLRIETLYPDGTLARRIAYANVTLPVRVSPSDCQSPRHPGLRQQDRSTPATDIPQRERRAYARQLGLGTDAPLGFHLMQITSSAVGGKANLQLLYSDGIESISLFAQDGGQTPQTVPANWQRASIQGATVYQEQSGHTNVFVWSRNGHRFTAISHLASDALATFVGGELTPRRR